MVKVENYKKLEGLCTQFAQKVSLRFCLLLKKLSLEIIQAILWVWLMQER